MITVAVAGWATTAAGSDLRKYDFDIPAADAATELTALYNKTGVRILYTFQWQMPAQGVKGSFTVEEALVRLLAGTGLICQYAEGGGSIVVSASREPLRGGHCLHPQRHPLREAQGPAPTPQEEMPQVRIVSHLGTNILGLQQVGSPLITWDQVQIRLSGAQNLPDFLARMTQNFGGGPTQQTFFGQAETFTNTDSGSAANLRGLGSRATLVLLNGRPLAPSGTAAAYVDLLQIPLSAVSQVEVLLDGASAIYGSDAVGGVVNIHTKEEYIRPETLVEVGSVTDGRQERHRISQELGGHWETGSLLVVGEVMHRGALAANARAQNSSDRIPSGPSESPFYYTNPGNLLSTAGNYPIPRGFSGQLDLSTLTSAPLNRADSYADSDIVPNQTRSSVLIALRQALGTSTMLFSDVLWTQRHALKRFGGQEATLDVTASPFLLHPSQTQVSEQYSLLDDLGPEITTVNVRTLNATVGMQVELPRKWLVVLSGSDSLESENQITYGVADLGALQDAVSESDITQAFNPFVTGPARVPATQLWYGSRSQLWDFQLTANGPWLHLPAGPLHEALGLEYRDQRFSSGISQNASSNDLRRELYAGFAEVVAPLLGEKVASRPWRRLTLSLAGRIEHYSDFGRSFAPRVALTWEPVEHFELRGTWARSVRAPNMEDLLERTNTSFVSPLGASSALIWSGGNAGLHVEKATTHTLGLGFKSDAGEFPRFTASLNYFDILFRDRIQASTFSGDLLSNPVYASLVTLNPSASAQEQVCARSKYLSMDGSSCMAAQVGAIVDLRTRNAGRLWTDGIDVQLGTNFDAPLGKLGFSLSSTYILDYQEASTPDAPLVSELDTLSNPLAWHVIGTGTWRVGAAQASFTIRHTKGYRNLEVQPPNRVGAWTTGDLRLSYQFNAQDLPGSHPIEVAINCENVTNSYSPFAVNTTANLGYDQENGSLQGRVVTLSVYMQY